MKKIKNMGHLMKFKVRRAKGEGEEYLWWKYWNKGDSNKEILSMKLPKYSAKEYFRSGRRLEKAPMMVSLTQIQIQT